MDLKNVIIRPIITEKSTDEVGRQNKYSFQVAMEASKNQIKKAIEKFFKVNVLRINVAVIPGKTRYGLRTRKETKKADWKKAIVRIKEGQKIDIFPAAFAGKEEGK